MKRVLGEISDDIIDKWEIEEHRNKKIVLYFQTKMMHCDKHKAEYIDDESFYYTMDNLENIIKNPDYVFCDKKKSGLEYFKKLKENVLVVVRIESGNELKVVSVYPVTQTKIENRRKKEEYSKYVKGQE